MAVVRGLGVSARRVGARTREHAVDLCAARDRRVNDGVAAVADKLVVRRLEAAAARALVVGLGASVDATAQKLAAHQRALVKVVTVKVEVERTAAFALGLVGQRATDAATFVTATVAECLAHALAKELALTSELPLSDLIALEQKSTLAAAAGTVDLLVAWRALGTVALEWARMAARAGLGARLSARRNRRRTVGSRVAWEHRQRCRAAWASGDHAGGGRTRNRASGVRVTLLQALVNAALVLLGADALAGEAAFPRLVRVAAHLAPLLVPATRSDLLLLAAVAANSLDLNAVGARTKVAQPVTGVFTTRQLAVADFVADRRQSGIVRARGRALDCQG